MKRGRVEGASDACEEATKTEVDMIVAIRTLSYKHDQKPLRHPITALTGAPAEVVARIPEPRCEHKHPAGQGRLLHGHRWSSQGGHTTLFEPEEASWVGGRNTRIFHHKTIGAFIR